jgi:IPT/TIG domain-containing protein
MMRARRTATVAFVLALAAPPAGAQTRSLTITPDRVSVGSTQPIRVEWSAPLAESSAEALQDVKVTVGGVEAPRVGAATRQAVTVNLPAQRAAGDVTVRLTSGDRELGAGTIRYSEAGRDLPPALDRLLMLLVGALIAIAVFYVRTRAVGPSAAPAATTQAGVSAVDDGALTFDPPQAARGTAVAIRGGAFGVHRGTVTFGHRQAAAEDVVQWTSRLIVVRVPAAARPGPMPVIVTRADAHQIATPSAAFRVVER